MIYCISSICSFGWGYFVTRVSTWRLFMLVGLFFFRRLPCFVATSCRQIHTSLARVYTHPLCRTCCRRICLCCLITCHRLFLRSASVAPYVAANIVLGEPIAVLSNRYRERREVSRNMVVTYGLANASRGGGDSREDSLPLLVDETTTGKERATILFYIEKALCIYIVSVIFGEQSNRATETRQLPK